jgi:hypothetical protein
MCPEKLDALGDFYIPSGLSLLLTDFIIYDNINDNDDSDTDDTDDDDDDDYDDDEAEALLRIKLFLIIITNNVQK